MTAKRIYFMAFAPANKVIVTQERVLNALRHDYPSSMYSEDKEDLVENLIGYVDSLMDEGEFEDGWAYFMMMYRKIREAK